MLHLLRNLLALYGAYELYRRFLGSPPERTSSVDGTYRVAEEMPLYGIESTAFPLPDYAQARRAAEKRMLEFIYNHLEYPAAARQANSEGMAVVNFIVETDGSMSELKVIRDPGHDMGAAALKTIQKMQSEGAGWRPAYEKGRPVRLQFAFPIKFKRRTES